VSYNASAVKIYKAATSSLEGFENKNIFFYICKKTLWPATTPAL
jgi:hypothetical protein